MNELSDFASSYNRALRGRARNFVIPNHTLSYEIAKLMCDHGYFTSVSRALHVTIELKFSEGKPVLQNIRRVSKRSKRVYINRKYSNSKTIVLSTSSKGILIVPKGSLLESGGEVLFELK